MSAILSWLLLLGLFVTSLLWAEKIGQAVDWVLDRMGWADSAPPRRARTARDGSVAPDAPCPCGQDRQFHERLGQ